MDELDLAVLLRAAQQCRHAGMSPPGGMIMVPKLKPRYQVLIMLDEPQGLPETGGYATSGWNAAPTAGKVIARIAPMLGIEPRFDLAPAEQLILAKGAR